MGQIKSFVFCHVYARVETNLPSQPFIHTNTITRITSSAAALQNLDSTLLQPSPRRRRPHRHNLHHPHFLEPLLSS